MKTSPLDLVIVIVSLALCGVAFLGLWSGGGVGDKIELSVGEERREVSLRPDRVLKVEGRLGVSEIEFADGRVRFVRSPCKNQYCTLSGWLNKGGEMAVCLPNGVSVRVLDGRQFDAINF